MPRSNEHELTSLERRQLRRLVQARMVGLGPNDGPLSAYDVERRSEQWGAEWHIGHDLVSALTKVKPPVDRRTGKPRVTFRKQTFRALMAALDWEPDDWERALAGERPRDMSQETRRMLESSGGISDEQTQQFVELGGALSNIAEPLQQISDVVAVLAKIAQRTKNV